MCRDVGFERVRAKFFCKGLRTWRDAQPFQEYALRCKPAVLDAVGGGGNGRKVHMCGLFFAGYGVSRFFVEFFRQADLQYITPDNPMGYVIRLGDLGLSMGQLLSLPMIIVGLFVIAWARRRG